MSTERRAIRSLSALATGAALFVSAAAAGNDVAAPQVFPTRIDQLYGQFNRDVGTVRLLLLLSPT